MSGGGIRRQSAAASQFELARRSHDGRNRLVEARNAVEAVCRACVEGESNDDVKAEKHGTLEVVGFTVVHFFFFFF